MQALIARPDLFQLSEQKAGDKKRPIHTFSKRGHVYVPQMPLPLPPPFQDDSDSDDLLTSFDKNADMDRVEREAKANNSTIRPTQQYSHRGSHQKAATTGTTPGFIVTPNLVADENGCYASIFQVSKLVYWTFFDRQGDPRPEEVNKAELYYMKGLYEDSKYCVISLNVECIRPLLDASSSPIERTLAIHMTAITVSFLTYESLKGKINRHVDDSGCHGLFLMFLLDLTPNVLQDAIRVWLKQNYQYWNIVCALGQLLNH